MHARCKQTILSIHCLYIDELIVALENPIENIYIYWHTVKYFYIQVRPGTLFFVYTVILYFVETCSTHHFIQRNMFDY
jgi:hypothetical protein